MAYGRGGNDGVLLRRSGKHIRTAHWLASPHHSPLSHSHQHYQPHQSYYVLRQFFFSYGQHPRHAPWGVLHHSSFSLQGSGPHSRFSSLGSSDSQASSFFWLPSSAGHSQASSYFWLPSSAGHSHHRLQRQWIQAPQGRSLPPLPSPRRSQQTGSKQDRSP